MGMPGLFVSFTSFSYCSLVAIHTFTLKAKFNEQQFSAMLSEIYCQHIDAGWNESIKISRATIFVKIF